MQAAGIPGPWDHEPEVPAAGMVAYTAFWALQGDRNNGVGIGPIRWTAMDAYAVRHEIDGDDFFCFERYIVEMDRAFLAYHRERAERQGQGSESAGGTRHITAGSAIVPSV